MVLDIFFDTPEKRIQKLTEDIEKNPKDYRAYIDRGWAWQENKKSDQSSVISKSKPPLMYYNHRKNPKYFSRGSLFSQG